MAADETPVRIEGTPCLECHIHSTVALKSDQYVIVWCAAGHVSVMDSAHHTQSQLVYNFATGSK